MENTNGIYPDTGLRQVGVIHNMECWETGKEILQKFVNSQSKEGMICLNEQSDY